MKSSRLIVLIMCFLMIFSATAYAHKMTIEPLEDGIIQVLYDDGSFSSRTEVTVYDSNDEVIESGKLDEEGKFTYAASGDAEYIVADDGMGHKAEWTIGEEPSSSSHASKYIKVGVVLLALLAVVGLYYKRKGRKSNA